MPVIYSTATNDTIYQTYRQTGDRGLPIVVSQVLVRGGANRMSNDRKLITPKGVSTPVTDEQLALLKTSGSFQRHVNAGFVVVDEDAKVADKEANSQETSDKVAAESMEPKDGSAPKTPDDYESKGVAAPTASQVTMPIATSKAPAPSASIPGAVAKK